VKVAIFEGAGLAVLRNRSKTDFGILELVVGYF
jgi:hypothetical protein